MNDFRKLAHLYEQIGQKRFDVLVSSDNTGKVKDFCDDLIRDNLPTTMTVGDRTYEILSVLRVGEKEIDGHTFVERAKEMNAHLGEDDARYLLDHQQDIPKSFECEAEFVFTGWRDPNISDLVHRIWWWAADNHLPGDYWVEGSIRLDLHCLSNYKKVLRRIK